MLMTFLRQISLAPGVKATTVKFYPEGYTLQPPDRKRSLSVKSERYGINLFARNREVLEVYGVGPRGRVSGDDFVLIIHREKETC